MVVVEVAVVVTVHGERSGSRIRGGGSCNHVNVNY